jgi:aspartate racemase
VLTIGLLGGMSWESSAEYYRLLNQGVRSRLGGAHSARCILSSLDFAEVHRLQDEGRWDEAGKLLGDEAARLEAAGAELLVLCSQTMHKVADAIEAAVQVPFLHHADVTVEAVKASGKSTVGMLGTKFSMEQDFYVGRLQEQGLTVLLPEAPDRETLHRIIYEELAEGTVREPSRAACVEIIERLWDRGAQGVILGCTELELLIHQADSEIPVFPVTRLHARAAVERALLDRRPV